MRQWPPWEMVRKIDMFVFPRVFLIWNTALTLSSKNVHLSLEISEGVLKTFHSKKSILRERWRCYYKSCSGRTMWSRQYIAARKNWCRYIRGKTSLIFVAFLLFPFTVKIGLPHPDPVVETSSLASVEPPDILYQVCIPERSIDMCSLSALQLEAVTYACQQHDTFLRSGERAGFLIGKIG